MKKWFLVAVSLLCASSCAVVRVNASSRTVLSASGSTLVSSLTPREMGKALVDQFAKRGFTLLDRRGASDDDITLKFTGTRTITDQNTNRRRSTVIGSVFYARIVTSGGQSQAYLVGKPMRDGRELCGAEEANSAVVMDACQPFDTFAGLESSLHVTGREEAETIQGIAVELELVGTAQRPPGPHEAPVAAAAAAPVAATSKPKGPCIRQAGEAPADAKERCARE
jgi:hypothetical protein